MSVVRGGHGPEEFAKLNELSELLRLHHRARRNEAVAFEPPRGIRGRTELVVEGRPAHNRAHEPLVKAEVTGEEALAFPQLVATAYFLPHSAGDQAGRIQMAGVQEFLQYAEIAGR